MKLKSYSSGSGCLSLVWIDGDQAASVPVTKRDAVNHLWLKECKHLRERGWRLMWDGHRWVYVQPWQRVNDNTFWNPEWGLVVIEDLEFSNASYFKKAKFRHHRRWREFRNLSGLMTLFYFVKNEKWIAAQLQKFPNAKYPKGLHRKQYVDPVFPDIIS